jgi:hypothetical protein
MHHLPMQTGRIDRVRDLSALHARQACGSRPRLAKQEYQVEIAPDRSEVGASLVGLAQGQRFGTSRFRKCRERVFVWHGDVMPDDG